MEGNVAHNTLGHAFFFEDGVEYGNAILGNLAVLTRAKDTGTRLGSDITSSSGAVSAFWY